MPPVCFICNERNIDFSCRCMTCKKSVCKKCYVRLIDENDNIFNKMFYKCPFCNITTQKDIDDLDKDVIYKFFKIKNFELQEKNIISKSIIHDLREDNDNLQEELNYVKNQTKYNIYEEENTRYKKTIYKLQQEINDLEIKVNSKPLPEKKVNHYRIFFKIKHHELKEENPNMSPQNILKEISILWKEEKKKMIVI